MIPTLTGIVSQQLFNIASGGTESTVTNYNGTGETWKIHSFTDSGTLTVSVAIFPFRYLLCAGGGGGGIREVYFVGTGSGGAGGVLAWDQSGGSGALTLTETAYSITVGSGGGGNTNGGNTVFAGQTAVGGGHGGEYGLAGQNGGSGGGGGYTVNPDGSLPGGTGIAGPPRQGFDGSAGPYGVGGALNYQSNITGSVLGYGGGSSGRGNGGAGSQSQTPGSGTSGIAIVAYRVG